MKRANKIIWQPFYLSISPQEKSTQKKRDFFMLRLTVQSQLKQRTITSQLNSFKLPFRVD